MLAKLWERIGIDVLGYAPVATTLHTLDRTLALEGALVLTRVFFPYQLNPLNIYPLREIVTHLFDFERLRADCRIKPFVAATQIRTVRLRLFETPELSRCAPGVGLFASVASRRRHRRRSLLGWRVCW
ncbi:MAG TPA: hypothetical protein VKB53_10190 [Gammaproteobacteria bacterium]|nr:hypothetical protein [Gammaproteobacteria bacterium]HKH21230.1 hypothetical protein [Gammaproteobacteria bacterium]